MTTIGEDRYQMSEDKARAICSQIEKILLTNGIHYSKEEVRRPVLKFINIREISIKINGK